MANGTPNRQPGLALPPGVIEQRQQQIREAALGREYRMRASVPILAELIATSDTAARQDVDFDFSLDPNSDAGAREILRCVDLAIAAGDALLSRLGAIQFVHEPADNHQPTQGGRTPDEQGQ